MFVLAVILAATPVEMRRETSLDFAIDEAFQQDGGVQFFYEFAEPDPRPKASSALARFRAMDEKATLDDPYHVMMSRLVYTVERDITFFTETRARDVKYLRQVAPEIGVTVEADGTFRAEKAPSNRFRMTWLEAPTKESVAADAVLTHFFEFIPKDTRLASIIVQKNFDFARVMGWRTAERAITFTAHESVGPGRTRIHVCTMSLLHHVPPFFLGGKERVFRESIDGAAKLIAQLRAYAGK